MMDEVQYSKIINGKANRISHDKPTIA